MSISSALPWWGKIGAKLILSRLPVPYSWWRRLGVFRHGGMNRFDYAAGVFERHAENASVAHSLRDKTVLELGPGDGIATAIIVAAHGGRSLLVDVGNYAEGDCDIYRSLAANLRTRGLTPPDLGAARSVAEMLEACSSTYLTEGLRSLRQIEDRSVDFVFSHAVLEHIRRHEFVGALQELRRVTRNTGIASHRVDLRDHLGGGLNNLRFSDRVWESRVFSSSGFYTNRLRYTEMLSLFRDAGFSVEVTTVERWNALPIRRARMAPEFAGFTEEDLLVSGFDVVLRPA